MYNIGGPGEIIEAEGYHMRAINSNFFKGPLSIRLSVFSSGPYINIKIEKHRKYWGGPGIL